MVAIPVIRRALLKGALALTGDGLRRPVNAPNAAPIVPGVQPGTSTPIVRANQVIVFGPSGAVVGVFVYQAGTRPALGNPPIAWLTSGTKDPYGNTLPSTSGVAGSGTFRAGNTITNASGEFGYSGNPVLGNLVFSDTQSAGTDSSGNAYLAGRSSYINNSGIITAINLVNGQILYWTAPAPGGPFTQLGNITFVQSGGQLQIDASGGGGVVIAGAATTGRLVLGRAGLAAQVPGWAQLVGQATPANAVGTGIFYANANGTPAAETGNGLAGALPIVQTDASTNSNANAVGARQITAAWSIPAFDMRAGTVYEIEVPFQATMEGQTLELGLSIDGSTTFTVNDTIGSTIVAAGTVITGLVRVIVQILTTGAGGTFNAFVFGSVGQASALTTFTNSGSLNGNPGFGGTIDTTIAHNIRVNSLWGASAVGQTVSGYGSKFTRSGP